MSGTGPPSSSSLGSFKHSQRYANVATRYSQSRERERNAAEEGRRGTEREALLDDAERGSSGGTRSANGRSGWSCVKALTLIVLLVVVVMVAVVYGTGGLDGWMTRTDDDADGKTSTRTASDSARSSRAARRAANDDEDEDAVSVRPPPPAIDVEEEEEPLSPPPPPRRPPAPRRPSAPSEEEDEPASVDPYAVSPTPSNDDDDAENAYDDGEERDPSTVNDAAGVGTKASSDAQTAATTTTRNLAVEANQSAAEEVETADETPAIARVPESSLGQAILKNRKSARAVYKFEADPAVAPGIGPNVEPVTPREPVPVPRKGENK